MADRSQYGRTDPAQARRRRIKAEAKRLILERGIAGAQMKDVAARSGVGKKTLYRYYPSMAALAQDLLLDIAGAPDFAELSQGVGGADGLERLRGLARAYCEYCLGHDDDIKFFFEYDYHFRDPDKPAVQGFWRDRPHAFHRALEQGIADGSIRLRPERVHAVGLLIDHAIFAAATRLVLREGVYAAECAFTRAELRSLPDLLVNGVLFEALGADGGRER